MTKNIEERLKKIIHELVDISFELPVWKRKHSDGHEVNTSTRKRTGDESTPGKEPVDDERA